MQSTNPAVIPRNHLVEAAIRAAYSDQDFSVFHTLVEALQAPYAEPSEPSLTLPPKQDQQVHHTFCGT